MPTTVPLVVKTNEYGPLISPFSDRNKPRYNWYAFKHSYSGELVKKLIDEFNLGRNSWVLDPFCGGGTTLLACKEMGIYSEGFDILPFSVFLSNVKTRNYQPIILRRYLGRFYKKGFLSRKNIDLPDIKIIREAFSPNTKKELLCLKSKIDTIRNPKVRDFYMLGLLSILESVSNTSKSGGFLRIKKKTIINGEVTRQFLLKIEAMINDVGKFINDFKFPDVKVGAKISDSRVLKTKRKFDAIITSPPYPNRHDYTRIYGLELIVGFIKNHDELKKIRYNTLRSHVEAKKQFEANGYKKPRIIDALINKIRKAGLNNSQVPKMIEGYFEDMYLSLLRMKNCLKKNGKIALVVSNVRFGGINVPVDKILADIGEQVGLSTDAIFTARYRGNSAQQMQRFKRNPSRESVLIWRNN
ncbi:MAG: DNA methyltransferase [Candidatus Nealsonbacteria bacterium]|nr:DNA methyltransferase [Candidatus Nealsonbacteria bacterium]